MSQWPELFANKNYRIGETYNMKGDRPNVFSIMMAAVAGLLFGFVFVVGVYVLLMAAL